MSEATGSYQEWLRSHGMSQEMLESWDISVYDKYFLVPVYSLTGKRVFRLKRNFYGEQKYNVEPSGAKRGFQLYGVWKSLVHIANYQLAVCVEGFSDFVAIFPEVNYSCALLGSRMTKVQREVLRCFTNRVILWSDGDETGENSARAITSEPGFTTFGFVIDGLDPAAYVQQGGSADAAVSEALKLATRYSFVKFDRELSVMERLER